MRVGATIQARMGSERLPGKMLKEILGRPILSYMVERVRWSTRIEEIVIATSTHPRDDAIEALAEREGVAVYRGSESDVLGRVVGAIQQFKIDVHVELYGDCPLTDPEILDGLVRVYEEGDYACVFNALTQTYPSGLEAKVHDAAIYIEQERVLTDPRYREHTALCIRDFLDKYAVFNLEAPPKLRRPEVSIELDTAEDFELLKSVFEEIYPRNPEFTTLDVLGFLDRNPAVRDSNRSVSRRWKTLTGGEQAA